MNVALESLGSGEIASCSNSGASRCSQPHERLASDHGLAHLHVPALDRQSIDKLIDIGYILIILYAVSRSERPIFGLPARIRFTITSAYVKRCLLIQKAALIWMRFGIVCWMGPGTRQAVGFVGSVHERGNFGGGRRIVTNDEFAA